MKTKHLYSFTFNFILILLFASQANAQNGYDFEDGSKKLSEQTYCKISEVEGNNLARLFQGNASIEFEFEDVSEISFRYSAKKVGDDYSLILETRMDRNKSWEKLSTILAKDEDSRIDILLLPKTHAVSEVLGKRFFRIRLVYPESGGNGEAYIDDISSKAISGNRMREMQESMRTENMIDKVQKTLLSEEKNKCEDIAGQYNRIQKTYSSNFEKLVKLNYRSNVVVLVGKLTEYSNSRSQMGNPVVYSEFSETIASIKAEGDALTDTIVGGFVSQLANNVTKRTSMSGSGKQSGFGKVVNVLKEVGNLISIGKVDNVINSVKSIVGTLFNRQNLEMKYPVKDFIQDNKGRWQMKNSPVNANKINLLFKKGIDNLHKLDRLVAISKEENSIYLEESKELIALAEQASDYSSDLNRFIISYFETINVTIDDRIIDEELTKVDDRTHDDYQNKINEYFKNITPNCSKSMTIVKTYETDVFVLQKLRENNKKVEQFYNEYRTISTNLKNHFNLVKAKLGGDDKIKTKPRANPYNPTTEAKSYAKYEQLRESSLTQLQEIITLLATVFPEEK